jgi:hypothetical protein
MSKGYMEGLGIKDLVGRKIDAAYINESNDFIKLETDKGPLYLTWVGDCCTNCFLAHLSGSKNLIGSQILEARDKEYTSGGDRDNCEVIDTFGTLLKTSKGYVDFESRALHNGYYGGMLYISDDEPMDQYHSPRNGWQKEDMKPLKDF